MSAKLGMTMFGWTVQYSDSLTSYSKEFYYILMLINYRSYIKFYS